MSYSNENWGLILNSTKFFHFFGSADVLTQPNTHTTHVTQFQLMLFLLVHYPELVRDRNLVSVKGAKIFFAKTETLFFQILLIFSYFLGEYKFFISLKINPDQKKNLMFGRKFGFRGPFMMENISL